MKRLTSSFSWVLIFFLVASLLGLLGYSLLNQTQTGNAKVPFTDPPSFNLKLFSGYAWEGKGEISPALVKGRPLVINFWASWCVPCRDEAPVLEKLWREYSPQGVVFLGIAYQDRPQESLAFLKQYGVSYPTGPDTTGEISIDYGTTGIPETWFIGADGKVKRKYIQPLSEQIMRRYLEEISLKK